MFRVYLTPEQIYFIRIGGARNQETAVAVQFGLVGALVAWSLSKSRKSKQHKKVLENETKTLDALLEEHKRNHVIPISAISEMAIEPMGRWAYPLAKWTFKVAGEKKAVTCVFDKTEDVQAALERLPSMFPGLKVKVEFDEGKKKFRKVQ